jgi:uncharacterized protein YkwD
MSRLQVSRRMMLAAALGLAPAIAEAQPAARVSTREAATAARLINAYRASRGLAALRVDARLNAVAAEHARAMAGVDLLSHDIGGGYAARMRRHGLPTASENIGWGYETVAEAVAAWRASPAHDANLVKPHGRMGLARAVAPGMRPYWALVLAP